MSTKTTIISKDFKFEDDTAGSIHIYSDFLFEDTQPIRLEFEGLGICIQASIDKDDLGQLEKLVSWPYDAKKLLGLDK